MKKLILFLSVVAFFSQAISSQVQEYDIVVYGGTSAGIMAAVQSSRLNKSVILIHPGEHIGGMTSSGLSCADTDQHTLIGGVTREFFANVRRYYQNDAAWPFEAKRPIKDRNGKLKSDVKTMWVFEPRVAEGIFKAMIKTAKVPVVLNERLDLANGVEKEGKEILQIHMESGNIYKARVFIDATYEGDLMAGAGVSYTVGRESNALYGETLNGIRPVIADSHVHIDPYVIKGDPESGFLPRVYPNAGGSDGEADQGVQAYTYRLCLTDVPENRVMIEKPIDYDESEYEILFRAVESRVHRFFKTCPLPNRKADCNNTGIVSIDYIGKSWEWTEADHAKRQEIAYAHQKWQRGLLWTLQNHPRIPPSIKKIYAPWGLAKDEFIKNNHWPYELYVREARRMVSSTIITEHTALGKKEVKDGVGLATYAIDSHNAKYYVNSKQEVALEGGIYVKISDSFPISYGALVPKKGECQNLIVPVCLSATHVGYAPIRMEPTFMVLGQSAATAAALSIDLALSVQDLPYALLKSQLLRDGQVLEVP